MKVRVHKGDAMEWVKISSLTPESMATLFSPAELNSEITFHEPGSEQSLQLFEIKYQPGAAITVHAHLIDEIIYVVDGSMIIGHRELGPGSSLFVAGNTLYQFRAGPQGLRMLNFRPNADNSFITREEFLKTRPDTAAVASEH